MSQNPGVIMVMIGLAVFLPVTKPALTFEQRWEPVKQLPPMIDKSPRELTFEERWEPVRRLPQMLNYEREEFAPRIIPVRTIPIRPEPAVHVETIERSSGEGAGNSGTRPTGVERAKTEIVGRTVPSPLLRRKVSLDLCQRHGMRKVHYGRTWRCRK